MSVPRVKRLVIPIQIIIQCFEKIKRQVYSFDQAYKLLSTYFEKAKGETKEEESVENKVTKHKKQIGHCEVLKEEDGKRKM